jgi:hypothetical protein
MNQRRRRSCPQDDPRRMLATRLRPLPLRPLPRAEARSRALPQLLQQRPRPHRPPHQGTHPRRHRPRCKQDEGNEMSRTCRHISETVQLKGLLERRVSPGVLRPLAQPRRYVVRDGDLRQRAQDASAPRAEARRLSPSRDPSAVAIDRTPGSSQASRLPPAVSKTRLAGPSAELTSPAPWWRASWTAKFRASRARSSETWASYWAGSSERHPTARAVAARAVADKKAHRHRRTHRAGEGSSNRA